MFDNLDYDEILDGFDDNDYVYIVETCLNVYATTVEPELGYCDICGTTDWLIGHDYVYKFRYSKYLEENEAQHNKELLIPYKNKKIGKVKVKLKYDKMHY